MVGVQQKRALHCKMKSWWQGHAVLPWCDAVRGSSAPVKWQKDEEGRLFWLGNCWFWCLGPRNLRGRKLASGSRKRNLPGVSQNFPTLGKKWKWCVCAHTVTAATPCAARSCERWRPQPQSDSPGLGLGSHRGWFGYNLAAFGECLLGQRFFGFHLSHAAVTLRSDGETTNASFRSCGMLAVGLGCQQEAAPLLLRSLQGKQLGKNGSCLYGCCWTELSGGCFPAKPSKEHREKEKRLC